MIPNNETTIRHLVSLGFYGADTVLKTLVLPIIYTQCQTYRNFPILATLIFCICLIRGHGIELRVICFALHDTRKPLPKYHPNPWPKSPLLPRGVRVRARGTRDSLVPKSILSSPIPPRSTACKNLGTRGRRHRAEEAKKARAKWVYTDLAAGLASRTGARS